MADIIKDHTIEPNRIGSGWVVWTHGEYGPTSVLAGYPMRVWTEWYDTLEEAQADWPEAMVLEHTSRAMFIVPEIVPEWADPAAAGERWNPE